MSNSPLSELHGKRRITVRLDAGATAALDARAKVVIGDDPQGAELQVLIAERPGAGDPAISELRELHRWRLGRKSFPLVTVIRPSSSEDRSGASEAGTIREPAASPVQTPGGRPDSREAAAGAAWRSDPPAERQPVEGAATAGAGQTRRVRQVQPSLLTDHGDEAPLHRRWLGGRVSSRGRSAAGYPPRVLVVGPDPEVEPVRLPEEQAARMLQAALDEPSAVSARRRIVGLLKQSAATLDGGGARPGVDNSGLFSLHYLIRSLPGEHRWTEAQSRARPLLHRRGTDLIRCLGFRIGERLDQALVLMDQSSEQRAVAVLLERTEMFEAGSGRLGMSPAAYGLDKASKRGAQWLILLRGDQIRLYATKPGTGVGSRSPVETWFQLDLAATLPEDAAYLELVFSAAALASGGTVADLLAGSKQFAADLGGRLRQRVYERVVPGLAVGVAEALDRHGSAGGSGDLSYAYRLSLRIFFRLLFQAYAEDCGLLPYGRNERFDRHSLKRLATTFSDDERMRRGDGSPPVVSRRDPGAGEAGPGRPDRHVQTDDSSTVAAAVELAAARPPIRGSAAAGGPAPDAGARPNAADEHGVESAREAAAATHGEARPNAPNRSASTFDPGATTLWRDLQTIWRAIDKGDRGLDIPAYNGGLFDADATSAIEGTDLVDIELGDDCIGPALRDLLVDETPDGDVGPVDFRSLSVREFGTIYEGLLESELSRAETDLAVDRKGVYVPAGTKDEVVVPEGGIYFHNRSGQRKATGSYFTPEFAVEHLLDHALEPVLAEHLKRVAQLHDRGDHAGAAEAFWDFRVADISMGSGHFLIAAVDRIERGMRSFLADRPLASVNDELGRLERKAREALGAASPASDGDLSQLPEASATRRRALASPGQSTSADGPRLEASTLLRRQIARRCIHGVDVNETAVELARVAVWIHTFVPGLPMSTLDHNLVCGDSLTGIGTVDEALDVLDPDRGDAQRSFFSQPIEDAMAEAAEALREVAAAQEADTAEVLRNREALEDAKARAEPARRLFDAAVAVRLGVAELPQSLNVDALAALPTQLETANELRRLRTAHMPTLFPDVFTRERPGFDVLIGNPPWKEARIEEQEFWALRFPGYQGLQPAVRAKRLRQLKLDRPDLVREYGKLADAAKTVRKLLLAGPYPSMGVSDPDLYKAFCWRFWQLVRDGGAVGVVLPRSALAEKGCKEWRLAVLDAGAFADVTLLLNKGRWVFETIHPQYTVGLVCLRRGADHDGAVRLRGPYDNHSAYHAGMRADAATIPVGEFLAWSDSAALPLIPSADALRVFRKMRRHPRLGLQPSLESASRPKILDTRYSILDREQRAA